MNNAKTKIFASGALIGIISLILMKFGNPLNMGICVACFYRDITGALGLHRAAVVQYLRPEISGFLLGAFLIALMKGEFNPRGGSSPIIRFVLGFFLMVGSLVFLGCPLRMILRLANGDLNAIVALLGYLVGIYIGVYFLKQGFTLGRSTKQKEATGYVMPILCVVLLVFAFVAPAFIFFSEKGPGALRAPMIISLIAGLVVGAVIQRTRLCTCGGIRDIFLMKDYHLFFGLLGLFIFALLGNLIFSLDTFKLGFVDQPVAHNSHIWNFLGMVLAGITACLLGGCPLRQTVLSGEGDGDASVTILGMILGAACAHNFGLAASPKGVKLNGKVAVVFGLIVVLSIAYSVVKSNQNERRMAKKGA